MTSIRAYNSAPVSADSHRSFTYDINDANLRPPHRHALLHVPDTYQPDVPAPLIVALHGKAQPPSEFEYHTQLSNKAFNTEAIVAYPEGIKVSAHGRVIDIGADKYLTAAMDR